MKPIRYSLWAFLTLFSIQRSVGQSVDSLNVFPNPFSTSATVQFELTESDTVKLMVYGVIGQIVETILDSAVKPPGQYSFSFGSSLPPGIYIVHLNLGSEGYKTKKAIKAGGTTEVLLMNGANEEPQVYPNPAHGLIHFPIDGLKTIVVRDLTGKILVNQLTDLNSISISDLPPGPYFLTVLDSKGKVKAYQQIVKF